MNGGYGGHAYGGGEGNGNVNMNMNVNGYGLPPYGSEPAVSAAAAAAARPTSISDPYYGNTNTNINANTNTALSFSQNPNIATSASASLHGHGHGGHVHSRQHQHQRQTHLSLNSHSNSHVNSQINGTGTGTGARNMNGHNNSSAASYAHNSSAAYSHGNSNSNANVNVNVTSTTHREDVYEPHSQYPQSSHQQQQQRPPSLSNVHDQNHSLEKIKNSMNGNGVNGNGSMLTYSNSDVNGVNGVNGNQHINTSISGNGHGNETNNTHTHRTHGDINSSSVNANTSYTDNQKRSNSNSDSNKKATNINNANMNMNMNTQMNMGMNMNMNSKVNMKHRTTDTHTPVTDNTTNSNMNSTSTSTNNYNPGTGTGTAGSGNDTKTDTAMESDDHDYNQPQTHDPYSVKVTITTAPKYAKAATIHKSKKANRRAQFKHRMEHFYKHSKDLNPRSYFRSRISTTYRNPNAYANLNNGFGGNRIGNGHGHGYGYAHDNGTVDTGSNEPGNERLNPTLAHSYHSHCLKECQRNVESLKIMIETTASVAEASRSLEIRNQSKSNGKVNEVNGNGGGSDKLRKGDWNGAEHGNRNRNRNGAVDKDTMRGLLTGVETPEIQAEHNNKNANSNANGHGHGHGTVTVTGNQNELLASNVPSAFPKELTFRALAVYTTLRTLSGNYQGGNGNGGAGADQVKLLLSPYTPIAFLRALSLPHSCTILNQTMVQILRILFAHQGIGQYDKRGDGWARLKVQIPMAATKKREEGIVSEYIQRRDRMLYTDVIANDGDGDGDDPDDRGSGGGNESGSEKERGFGGILDGGRGDESGEEVETGRIYGGDNLTYLNEATWPLYYMDYLSTYGIDTMSLENGVSGLEGSERENGHDALNDNVNDHDIVDANELDDELLDIRTPEIDALFKNRPSEIPLSECEAPYKTFPWMTAMAISKRNEDAIANVSTNVNAGQQSSNEFPGSRSRASSSRAGPKASSSTNSSKIKRKSTSSRKRRKKNSTAEDHSSDEDSEYEEPEAISGFTPSGRKRKLGEQPTNYSRTDERNVEGLTNGAPPSGAIPRKQKSSRIRITIPRKGNVQTQNRKYGFSQSQMFCESERNPRGVTKSVYDDIYDLLNTDNRATSSANNGRDTSPGDTNEEEDHISGSGGNMNGRAVKVEGSVVMEGGKNIDIEMDVKSEPQLENETTVIKEEPRPSLEDQEVARYAFNGSLTMTNNIEEEPALDAGDECMDEKKSEEAEKSALAPLSNDDNIEQKANGGQSIQMKIMILLEGGTSHYNLNAEMKLSIIE